MTNKEIADRLKAISDELISLENKTIFSCVGKDERTTHLLRSNISTARSLLGTTWFFISNF